MILKAIQKIKAEIFSKLVFSPKFSSSSNQNEHLSSTNEDIFNKLELERLKLETTISESPAAIALFSGPSFVIEKVNQKWRELVGDREYIGKTYNEAYPELINTPLPGILKNVFESGESFHAYEMKVPVETNAGIIEDRFYDFSYVRIEDKNNAPYGLFCHALNVTDRVYARIQIEENEQRLLIAEERLSLTVKVAKVGFYDWDIVKNIITFSEQMLADWGMEKSATLEETILRIHPEDRDQTNKLIVDAIEGHKPYFAEYRVIRPDGHLIWIEAQGQITYDEQSRPTRFFGTSLDVTKRKDIEAKLKLESHKLETIFQETPAAMALWTGEDLVFEKINPAYQSIYSDRELLNLPIAEALPELKSQGFVDVLKNVFHTGQPFIGREVLAKIQVSKEGPSQERYWDFSYIQIKGQDGKPYGVYDHAIDVTEKALAKKLQKKIHEKLESTVQKLEIERDLREKFVAALSHDLRTPLTAAKLSAQIIALKDVPLKKKQAIANRIILNMDRADKMIRDILDASRIKAGEKVHIEIHPCNLNEIVKSTVEDLITMHGNRFIIDADSSEIEGHWDCTAIQRSLENLGNNAVKYGAPNAPVKFKLKKSVDQVTISVQNQGNPIHENDLRAIFEPYQRSASAISSSQKGWGIGLTLVKGFAEAHGGTIKVSSSEDKGTIFTILIPQDSRSYYDESHG